MSEWRPPPAVAQDYPKSRVETDGLKRLIDAVAGLKRDLRESTSNLLSTAGIFITRAGMRIASSLTVEGDLVSTGAAQIDGTLDVGAATTIGGSLGVTGDATFSGDMAITGTLSLPAGIIDNDALATPVRYDSSGTSQLGFAVTTTPTLRAPGTIVVPSGFTRATIWCMVTAGSVNSTTGTDYLVPKATIDGISGAGTPWRAGAGEVVAGTGTAIRTMTGLTGGQVITVGATVSASVASWASSGSSIASTDAVVWFSR